MARGHLSWVSITYTIHLPGALPRLPWLRQYPGTPTVWQHQRPSRPYARTFTFNTERPPIISEHRDNPLMFNIEKLTNLNTTR